MTEKITWIPADILERFMQEVFIKSGVSAADAKICAEILIAADKRGIDSHGVNRLKPRYIDNIKTGRLNPVTKISVVRESPTTAVIDGNNGIGFVVSKSAMQMAIDKAKKYGMGMTAVRNSNHYGIAGYYSLMAVEEGMIGINGTNATPSVAPTFGIEGMFGTNPLTFALPTDEEFPFFLDCATSTAQRGKIEVYARINKKTPGGWVMDTNGNPKTNSTEILKELINGDAFFLPLGGSGEETSGYKGYGYATVVEILCAALQGGIFLRTLEGMQDGKKVPYRIGHFFMAIDINAFTEIEQFKKTTGDILRQLRASKKMPGAERIYTAGEKEYLVMQERKDKGIPVNDDLLNELKQMAKDLYVSGYDFLI
ncbi:MAG: Ldh family oxidoreductase [Bacteroidia bacterium]|nr:Ldh family oxidoreductase [Bacteroidia bacterium]